jgi:membrane fusion protein, multidrug efflux system
MQSRKGAKTQRSAKKKYAVLAAVGWALVTTGCGQPVAVQSAGVPPSSAAVSTVTAGVEQWPSLYETTGTVRARQAATISARWMGHVREVKVAVGDRVRAGQLLVVLDARDLDAAAQRARAGREEARGAVPEADSGIAAAKANLELAQATFRRMTELYGKKSISEQEFDEASAKVKAAQAAHEMARAKRTQLDSRIAQAEQEVRTAEVSRSYAEVEAPFAGVVTAKTAEPGTLAAPGTPLLTIEGDGYRLEASVEESRAVRAGQAVSVTLDGRTIAARVSEVVPAVDAASRSYTVKVDLPADASIRSGMFGRASFAMGTRAVLAIPAAAVTTRGQLQSVMVSEGGAPRTRMVTLGARSQDAVEVLSGLSAGEKVVIGARP